MKEKSKWESENSRSVCAIFHRRIIEWRKKSNQNKTRKVSEKIKSLKIIANQNWRRAAEMGSPCGLIYLFAVALLATSGWWSQRIFMRFFKDFYASIRKIFDTSRYVGEKGTKCELEKCYEQLDCLKRPSDQQVLRQRKVFVFRLIKFM